MADPVTPALFGALAEKMRFLGERQRVLSENIANADTPNYAARDLRHTDFLKALQHQDLRLPLNTTNEAHLPPVTPMQRYAVDRAASPYEVKMDKNGVIIEEQMIKVSQTASDYSMASQLYKKYMDMLKISIPKL